MKKIGFIDYRLDEWHANNYPAWIAQACRETGLDWEVGYAWAEEEAPQGLLSTREWCDKFSVTPCDTLEEVCERSDALLILAPSNPEKHLPYAQRALAYGKNTYIDKTFAPDARQAEEIFALSRRYGAKIFSTSALRFATELQGLEGAHSVYVTGGGSNLEEYCIHILEMIVCVMGTGAAKVRYEGDLGQGIGHIGFDGGRMAHLIYGPRMPYALDVQAEKGQASCYYPVKSAFFPALLTEILRFYETGSLPVPEEQTMACMRLRDALLKAASQPGTVAALEGNA